MLKCYRSVYPSFVTTVLLEDGRRIPIIFVNGKYNTDNMGIQEHIEKLSFFGNAINVLSEDEVKAEEKQEALKNKSIEETRKKVNDEAVAQKKSSAKSKADAEASSKARDERQQGIIDRGNALKHKPLTEEEIKGHMDEELFPEKPKEQIIAKEIGSPEKEA